MFVWPGNSQTDKVFFDAAQWWKVAEREGFILVTICEQYSNTSVSVSHRDSVAFYRQLRDVDDQRVSGRPDEVLLHRAVRGQRGHPELSRSRSRSTSRRSPRPRSPPPRAPPARSTIDGVQYPASSTMIPNYHIYGYGDLGFLAGGLWDDTQNSLDSWAQYHLQVNGLELSDVDNLAGRTQRLARPLPDLDVARPDTEIPVLKLTKNLYRSHNTMAEESPLDVGLPQALQPRDRRRRKRRPATTADQASTVPVTSRGW